MNYDNKPQGYYGGVRRDVFGYIPKNVKRVLDVGCGEGGTLCLIEEELGSEVWGVEYVKEKADIAKKKIEHIFAGKIEDNIDNLPDKYFDIIIALDVLEHLEYPEDTILKLKNKLTDSGYFMSSIPNVRHWSCIYPLLFKRDWKYEDAGILDYTHLRFFTKKSIKRMYEKLGFDIVTHVGIGKTKWYKYFWIDILSLGFFNDGKYLQFLTLAKINNLKD